MNAVYCIIYLCSWHKSELDSFSHGMKEGKLARTVENSFSCTTQWVAPLYQITGHKVTHKHISPLFERRFQEFPRCTNMRRLWPGAVINLISYEGSSDFSLKYRCKKVIMKQMLKNQAIDVSRQRQGGSLTLPVRSVLCVSFYRAFSVSTWKCNAYLWSFLLSNSYWCRGMAALYTGEQT